MMTSILSFCGNLVRQAKQYLKQWTKPVTCAGYLTRPPGFNGRNSGNEVPRSWPKSFTLSRPYGNIRSAAHDPRGLTHWGCRTWISVTVATGIQGVWRGRIPVATWFEGAHRRAHDSPWSSGVQFNRLYMQSTTLADFLWHKERPFQCRKRSLFIPHLMSMATCMPPRDLERTPCRHPCWT